MNKASRVKRATSTTARLRRDGCWPSFWPSAMTRSASSPRTTWTRGKRKITWPAGYGGSETMKKKPVDMPKFVNEGEEAHWWASRQGREFVKQRSAEPLKKGSVSKGSRLVGQLNRTASVQIALRLPERDVTKAREIATRKGVGYQTLLKMLVHEGDRKST